MWRITDCEVLVLMDMYNPTPVPKVHRTSWDKGNKYYKSQRNRESAVRLCYRAKNRVLIPLF